MSEKKVKVNEAEGIPAAELLGTPEMVGDAEELVVGEVVEGDAIFSGLMVERTKVVPKEKGKNPYFTYAVNGNLRGVDVRVDLVPPDRGGYKLLGIVFDSADALPLLKVPYEIVDERTRRKTTGFTYKVMDTDVDGLVYECKLKPSADSSKRMLECLIAKAAKEALGE